MSKKIGLTELAKQFAKKELPESEVEFSGEIPAADIATYTNAALAHIAEHLELPGFRPGKVPKDMALKKVGEMAVLEEAVELFVKDFYPEFIEAQKIDAVGRPDIRITKLAPNTPVALTIKVTLYPEVSVPKNWKKLADKIPLEAAASATDEEVQKTLEDLQKSRAKKGEDGKDILPELNDEFAKSIGAFEGLEHLKEQIKKGIGEEKARSARDARRGKLIDALLEDTKVAVPRLFIESELEKILAQMREDVQRFGMTFDDYLKQSGKTEEAIRNDFREQAKKRAKLQLTLNKLAADEKVEADETAIATEMKHALEHFPDANPALVKVHIETVLRNEATLKILEGEVANETLAK
jgi:FKBP-type peptidyl-prolyl cis-trans isomerase (trigger factor)